MTLSPHAYTLCCKTQDLECFSKHLSRSFAQLHSIPLTRTAFFQKTFNFSIISNFPFPDCRSHPCRITYQQEKYSVPWDNKPFLSRLIFALLLSVQFIQILLWNLKLFTQNMPYDFKVLLRESSEPNICRLETSDEKINTWYF